MARRLLIVGDSITKGDGVVSFVNMLERDAKKIGRDALPVSIVNKGYNGLTSTQLIQPDNVYWDFCVSSVSGIEIAMLFLGANCHYVTSPPNGPPLVDLTTYKSNIVTALTRLKDINTGIAWNDGHPLVLCMSPPYVKDEDGANHVRMATYAEASRQAAAQVGVAFVNVFEYMAAACDDNQAIFGATYVNANAGVHPNERGHQLIHDAVEPRLRRLIYEGK